MKSSLMAVSILFVFVGQIISHESLTISPPDTISGYAYFPLNGGQCGLLEHDASTGMKDNANIGEFSRNGVDCISLGTYYSSQGWSGNGIRNPNKYLYFYLGPITNDFIMHLRKQDRLSFKAIRKGIAPDTIAAFYVDRYNNHTLLLKTFLPENEWNSFLAQVPITSIPVISSIRIYAWSSTPSQSNTVSGVLSVDDVQISFGISSAKPTSVKEEEMNSGFELSNAYPNPFNPSTTIRYLVPANAKGETAKVTLKVYDILGREVAILVDEYKTPGIYNCEWTIDPLRHVGDETRNGELPSGIYLYTLKAGAYIQTKKMILQK